MLRRKRRDAEGPADAASDGASDATAAEPKPESKPESKAEPKPEPKADRTLAPAGGRRARRADRHPDRGPGRFRLWRDRAAYRRAQRGGRWWLLPEFLVVVLVVTAFVAVQADLGVKLGLSADPDREPEKVAPPLELPPMSPAKAVARAQTDGDAGIKKLVAALTPGLNDPRLGAHRRMLVADLGSGQVVYNYGEGPVTPASLMKTLTTTAALESLRPETRFSTRVVRGAGKRVVLVGGGDPFLMAEPQPKGTYPARADLETLAKQTAAALKEEGTTSVSLGYDDSLFTGDAFNKRWPDTYRGDVVPPITALLVDEGHAYVGGPYSSDPSRLAADRFATALRAQGITVEGGEPQDQKAPKGTVIGRVVSAPVGQIASRVLLVSDNVGAEVLAHHVGIAEGDGGSFAGGAKAVEAVLTDLGVPVKGDEIFDGSGLSRDNSVALETIMGVLRVAASSDHPRLRQVITGLPVAGFSGSLATRFDTGAPGALGRVLAKTGTLRGVHGLAGVATDADGDVLGFVLVADEVAGADDGYAPDQLDRIAAALGACACRRVGADKPAA